ncbi:hypothetical protein OGM63_01705 [Plectonema radiosum NIES-515]|uniref:SPOR domain-containing protein n=1 Tax=Plectonema radiosum NIES-515 TaxID=2986073 RepID=A0ABT3AT10_9CYAN|nr:hypothetical protein [Plectonema radiosum]MCV3212253.1 hypothetical protein [Plectonema radiosum NIES-515]
MLSAIPSQRSAVRRKEFTSLVSQLSLLSLLFYSNPAQAQINSGGVLLTQALPPPPANIELIPSNQQALPQIDAAQQNDYNSQTTNQTTPSSQYQYEYNNQYQNQNQDQNNQNLGRYVVYVDNGNSGLLQQVRRVEPTALLRRYQGRSVIQAGTFSKPDNAQRRLSELASKGINGVRIVSLSNGQEVPYNYPDRNYPDRNYPDRNYPDRNYPGGYSGNNRSNYYYVAIPARSQDLPIIEDKIRRNIGQSAAVLQRNQPRGSHVAVGPFIQRSQAEQWNSYLRNLGFGNARVYYGK